MVIKIKRVYKSPDQADGDRILVERLCRGEYPKNMQRWIYG
jgi:uncharacterized protein YeaO (DUF488 family)